MKQFWPMARPDKVRQYKQTEDGDEEGWSQDRCQPAAEETSCVENEITSHESHGKA